MLAPRRCGKRGRPFWLRGRSRLKCSANRSVSCSSSVREIIRSSSRPFIRSTRSLPATRSCSSPRRARAMSRWFSRISCAPPVSIPHSSPSCPRASRPRAMPSPSGVDKVIFTGSSENGRDVLADLATTNTPAVMELSGEDAVLVFADADLDLVVRALGFGTRLNDGETCIAPRRLIVVQSVADDLLAATRARAASRSLLIEIASATKRTRVRFARMPLTSRSARPFFPATSRGPLARRAHQDRLRADQRSHRSHRRSAHAVSAASKASGFGSTRGDEGLLEMTFPHVVAVRSGNSHRHFDESRRGRCEAFFVLHPRNPWTRSGRASARCRDLIWRTRWTRSKAERQTHETNWHHRRRPRRAFRRLRAGRARTPSHPFRTQRMARRQGGPAATATASVSTWGRPS